MPLQIQVTSPFGGICQKAFIALMHHTYDHFNDFGTIEFGIWQNKEAYDTKKRPIDMISLYARDSEVKDDKGVLRQINKANVKDKTAADVYNLIRQYKVPTQNNQVLNLPEADLV